MSKSDEDITTALGGDATTGNGTADEAQGRPKAPYSRGRMAYLIFFIMFVQMFAMFSTDMYTPALPGMVEGLDTSETLVNLTIVLFFVAMLVAMLVFGPVSDKYGRKPLLVVGSAAYALSSVGCALSTDIHILLAFRILQALGAGASQVVGTAIVKDLFDGKTRENVLMIVQAFFVLGPICAPLIGGQILLFASWRFVFAVLAGIGILAFGMCLTFKESLPSGQRHQGSVLAAFSGLADVARSRSFVLFLLATSVFAALPMNAYLMGSSYIYETHFGFSAQDFSLFFGANAALATSGLIWLKVAKRFVSLRNLTTALLVACGVIGVGMMFFGQVSVLIFFPLMVALNTFCTMMRPYSVNTLLEMRTRDIGSASSFIGTSFSLMGVVGMLPALLSGDYILSLGALILIGTVISLICWATLLRSSNIPGITSVDE